MALAVVISVLACEVLTPAEPQLELPSIPFQHHAGSEVGSEMQWLFSTVKLFTTNGPGTTWTQAVAPAWMVLLKINWLDLLSTNGPMVTAAFDPIFQTKLL